MDVLRRLVVTVLALGLATAASTSFAISFFHSATDDGNNRFSDLIDPPGALILEPGTAATVNLWLDPTDEPGGGIVGFGALNITASGILTFSFSCVIDECLVGTNQPQQVELSGGDTDGPGDLAPVKVGTLSLNADGSTGDRLVINGGDFLDQFFGEGTIPRTVLAVVEETNVCGDVNEDGMFDPNDVDALRLHLADPAGGVLTPGGLARCAVIAPIGCNILQAVVMHRAAEDPAFPPGRAPVCDCWAAHSD